MYCKMFYCVVEAEKKYKFHHRESMLEISDIRKIRTIFDSACKSYIGSLSRLIFYAYAGHDCKIF